MGSTMLADDVLRPDGGKGVVVVGPDAALCAGARILRRAWVTKHQKLYRSRHTKAVTYVDHPIRYLAHAETCSVT
jgi:hypothetical protein